MNRIARNAIGIAVLLTYFTLVPTTIGQDAALESYESLVQRVNRLEESQQQLPAAANCNAGGRYFTIETVVVEPRFNTNVAGTIHDTGLLGAGETSFTHDFSSQLKISPRVEMGYAPQADEWGYRARFWHFQHDSNAWMVGDDIEVNFADDPDIAIDDNGLGITASQRTQLDVLDLDRTTRADIGGLSILGGGGLRYANIEHNANWSDNQSTGERAFISNEFQGFGPSIFMEASKSVNCKRGLFLKARTSLLAGQQDLLLHSTRTFGNGPDDVIEVSNENGIMPVVEMQLGTSFARELPIGRVECSLAWETQAWFNAGVAAANESGGKDSDDFQVQRTANMMLNGFNVGVSLKR